MKVYVLSDPAIELPGAVAWEAICRDRATKLIIHYDRVRWVSRWVTVDRKRPFCIHSVRRGRWSAPLSYHGTLDAAVRAAQRLSVE